MAELSLDRTHTALLIADFYAARMHTIPHATEAVQSKRRNDEPSLWRDYPEWVCRVRY